CNWTVDYLSDLELERVQKVYSQKEPTSHRATEC
ncbi:HAD family phosphatase, partial [Nostoc sp. HG1]|nr:HAD family phosphatase [Nostoc sp. HG1]